MSKKVKKRPKPVTPRDPFWRLRRLLGVRRKDSAKAYRRAESRAAEQQAARDGDN